MVYIKNPKLKADYRAGMATIRDVAMHLMTNFNSLEIADALAEILVNEEELLPRIRITEEQLEKYFKIIGKTENGEKETRGRKKKIMDSLMSSAIIED